MPHHILFILLYKNTFFPLDSTFGNHHKNFIHHELIETENYRDKQKLENEIHFYPEKHDKLFTVIYWKSNKKKEKKPLNG